jgi:WD repeat-containing protein 45
VFSTKDGKILRELRRGADKAEIFCICFDKSSRFLACTSDKGTVHIFALGIGEGAAVIPPADASIPKSVPEGGAGTKAVKNNKSVYPHFTLLIFIDFHS